ncbi:TraB family protein [uncultured archaeon]|nr:TraB family protein [uncultured archaeon]
MPIERVKFGEKEILLLGTAHISKASTDEVKEAIENEKPDIVGVELDIKRFEQLRNGERWQNMNIGDVISSGQTYLFLLTVLLTNLQRSLGQQLGVKPGSEMIQAINAAEQKGIPVALLDRDVNITLKRAMQKMSIGEKLHFGISAIAGFFPDERKALDSEAVEKLKEKDLLSELMKQLAKELPSVKSVLVDERDAYIANSIASAPGKKVLAIVGAGHIEGIKESIGRPVDIEAISRVEKSRGIDWAKIIQWAIPVSFVILLGSLFLAKGLNVTLTAMVYWFLSTGLLAALGTFIAGGHPLSVLAAFLAAPFTTLHPLLAAGWVAGYVEAKIRNPKVRDFEGLANLNSFGDFTRNQVTRILLVVGLANIGATIGVIIGLPLVASLLG